MKKVILLKEHLSCVKPNENFLIVNETKNYYFLIESHLTKRKAEEAIKSIKDFAKTRDFKLDLKIFKKENITIIQE